METATFTNPDYHKCFEAFRYWLEAQAAAIDGVLLYGTGNPHTDPCLVYRHSTPAAGEGNAFVVYVYPEGEGYGKPCTIYAVSFIFEHKAAWPARREASPVFIL